MRKTIVLLFLVFANIVLTQDDLTNAIDRINELISVYSQFDLSTLKVSILDAINISKKKNVIATYLDFVNNFPVWVVLTVEDKTLIDPYTGKIISSQQYNHKPVTYTVSLKDAISLAFVSTGKGIYFAFLNDDGTWLIGSKEQIVHVSTKTPAVLSTQKREGQLKTPGGGKK